MKNIVIFTDEPGWHGKQLQYAFAQAGYESTFVSLTQCQLHIAHANTSPVSIPTFENSLPCAAFVRGVPGGSLEEVIIYLNVLHTLELLQIPVYNSTRAIERSVDKAMTSILLHQARLPTPKTWVVRDRKYALTIAQQQLNQKQLLISKPLFGSQGQGIRRIEKNTDLHFLAPTHGIYYLQQFIDCAGEGFSDYRVFVIDGKAVAVMRRKGKSWLNNVAQGATCEAVDLSPTLADLAIQATKILGLHYAGVDIIEDTRGDYWIIEVNSVPAWKGLESVCDVSIATLLVDDLIGRFLT